MACELFGVCVPIQEGCKCFLDGFDIRLVSLFAFFAAFALEDGGADLFVEGFDLVWQSFKHQKPVELSCLFLICRVSLQFHPLKSFVFLRQVMSDKENEIERKDQKK